MATPESRRLLDLIDEWVQAMHAERLRADLAPDFPPHHDLDGIAGRFDEALTVSSFR